MSIEYSPPLNKTIIPTSGPFSDSRIRSSLRKFVLNIRSYYEDIFKRCSHIINDDEGVLSMDAMYCLCKRSGINVKLFIIFSFIINATKLGKKAIPFEIIYKYFAGVFSDSLIEKFNKDFRQANFIKIYKHQPGDTRDKRKHISLTNAGIDFYKSFILALRNYILYPLEDPALPRVNLPSLSVPACLKQTSIKNKQPIKKTAHPVSNDLLSHPAIQAYKYTFILNTRTHYKNTYFKCSHILNSYCFRSIYNVYNFYVRSVIDINIFSVFTLILRTTVLSLGSRNTERIVESMPLGIIYSYFNGIFSTCLLSEIIKKLQKVGFINISRYRPGYGITKQKYVSSTDTGINFYKTFIKVFRDYISILHEVKNSPAHHVKFPTFHEGRKLRFERLGK